MQSGTRKVKRAPRSSRTQKPKILVVDNDPAVAETLKNYLGGKRMYSVLSAESGADGVEKALDHLPDLILLDTRLNDMSGLEAHERLQQNPMTRDIPVIYISAFHSLRVIEQATKMGAKGFITKPFTLSGIYTKMASVLHSS